MDAVTILREQSAFVSDGFSRVLAPLTDEQALWKPESAKTNPIAASVLHVLFNEDRLVQEQQGRPSILKSAGWSSRLDYNPREPWTVPQRVSADALRAYAAEVAAASRAYLEGLNEADLTREVSTPRGTRPLSNLLSLLLVIHKSTHMGEVAALLGCQGVTGFPV